MFFSNFEILNCVEKKNDLAAGLQNTWFRTVAVFRQWFQLLVLWAVKGQANSTRRQVFLPFSTSYIKRLGTHLSRLIC